MNTFTGAPGTVTARTHTFPATKRGPERTVESRTWHANPTCSHVSLSETVGTDVPADAPEAGLPCDYCAVVPDRHLIDPVETGLPVRLSGDGSGRAAYVPDAPTDKQVTYLTSLFRDLGMDDADEAVARLREVAAEKSRWTKRFVSEAIDSAKTELDAKRAAALTAAPAPSGRSNRFAAPCHRCGRMVDEGEGDLRKNGRWEVYCRGECQPVTSTDTGSGYDGEAVVGVQTVDDLPDVPQGHYAIESTGPNDLAFYRVDRPTEGKYAGRTFVKLVVGGHADSNVRYSQIPGILARIAADPDAGPRYGREIGRCCKCNRSLTDETSRSLGIGPDCRSRG